MKRRCAACGDEYRARRSDSLWCSPKCRKRAQRARARIRAEAPVPVAASVAQATTKKETDSHGYAYGPDDVPTYSPADFEDLPDFDAKGYVSDIITTAHKKWLKDRGTDGRRLP